MPSRSPNSTLPGSNNRLSYTPFVQSPQCNNIQLYTVNTLCSYYPYTPLFRMYRHYKLPRTPSRPLTSTLQDNMNQRSYMPFVL
jgi:hypothetical protein